MKARRERPWRSIIYKGTLFAIVMLWLAVVAWWLGSYFIQTTLTAERREQVPKHHMFVETREVWIENGAATIEVQREVYDYFSRYLGPFNLRADFHKAERRRVRTWAHYRDGFGWEYEFEVRKPLLGGYNGAAQPDCLERTYLTGPLWPSAGISAGALAIALVRLKLRGRSRYCAVCGQELVNNGICHKCGTSRWRGRAWRTVAYACGIGWLLVSGLWASSYFAPTSLSGQIETWGTLEFDHGLMLVDIEREVWCGDDRSPRSTSASLYWGFLMKTPDEPGWPSTHWGFGGHYHSTTLPESDRSGMKRSESFKLAAPLWLGWLLFTLLLVMLFRWRRRIILRAARDCCSTCGYDLTANVSGICPECGTPAISVGQVCSLGS